MPYTRSLLIDVPEGGHAVETRISLPGPAREREQGTANALIAPPHPLYGGDHENPVVRALEQTFSAQGFGTLSLNFRGVGESRGEQRGDLDEALHDLLAVARAAEAQPLHILSGYSFGACVALRAAQILPVRLLVLVAPAVSLFDPALMRGYPGRLRVVVGSEDSYAPHARLAELLAAAPAGQLEVLPGVDHFFSGAQLARLGELLPRLIA
jgi:alpha/beta superfamily hydrolase